MKRAALVYGSSSGTIIILGIIATIEFEVAYQWLGYLIMLIAFTAIFVAMKQYRDAQQDHCMSFLTGLKLGLAISLVASGVYILVWELYLFVTDYAFVSSYIDSLIEAQRAAGASEAELAQLNTDMEYFRNMYSNPLTRIPLTLTEIFPVGLLVSLVSAAFLRKSN